MRLSSVTLSGIQEKMQLKDEILKFYENKDELHKQTREFNKYLLFDINSNAFRMLKDADELPLSTENVLKDARNTIKNLKEQPHNPKLVEIISTMEKLIRDLESE